MAAAGKKGKPKKMKGEPVECKVESCSAIDGDEHVVRTAPFRRKVIGIIVAVECEAGPNNWERFWMINAEAIDGGDIGCLQSKIDSIPAQLFDRLIVPEKANAGHNTCSVGKSLKDGLWYGWSHRAICGFVTREQAIAFADGVS